MATKFRGANMQRHQRPYQNVGKLTDKPVGDGPYRADCDMGALPVDTMAKAESNSTSTRPQSSNERMAARDNNDSGDGDY